MGVPHEDTTDSEGTTIYCPRCGQMMLVAEQHMRMTVSCPHCGKKLAPWRIMAAAAKQAAAQATPPPPPMSPQNVYGSPDTALYSSRNRWIAGALAILLGPFGVHRFYMGFIGIGILQAALTVCSFLALMPLVAVWAFIEGILCFCGVMRDIDGLPLSG